MVWSLTHTDYIPLDTTLIGNPNVNVVDDFTSASRTFFTRGAFDVYTNNRIVTVNASQGTATATYFDLTTAFNRINDGTHRGVVDVVVNQSHSLVQPSVLNASGSGSANYSRVRVYPSASSLTVFGNFAGPLVDLNGGSNVVFDGRVNAQSVGTPYSLTLRNVNTSTTAGTSTLRFINGASNDTVRFVQLEGSGTSTLSGTVFFSTSTAVAGNNNNILLNNRITNAGGNRPVNSVYSSGTTAKLNTGNVLRGNEVFNIFHPNLSSQGILLESFNANWRLEGNSFYETGSLAPTSAATYSAIWVNNTGVNGTVIRGNFIGGTQVQAGGAAFTKTNSNSNVFYGIRINAGTSPVTQVDSNMVRNMSWTNSTGNNWFGIDVAAGVVDIGLQQGNRIGGSGAAVTLAQTTATTLSNLYGINLAGAGTIRVRKNTLSHIGVNTAISG
jgi:hypothetical protein